MALCHEWCGYCYDGRKGRAFHKGHFGYRKPVRHGDDRMRPKQAKPKNGSSRAPAESPWQDKDFEARYPHLMSHLCDEKWDDGTARDTSTLLFFVDGGVLKCCLNDRSSGRVCFKTAATMTTLLLALESGLEEDSLEWRAKRT